MQSCLGCQKKTSDKGKYCMHCGRRLNPRQSRWPGEILAVNPEADFSDYFLEVLGYTNGSRPDKTQVIRWLSNLIPTQQQVHIRMYGLDNKGRRDANQIAQEVGVGPSIIKDMFLNGRVKMRHSR
jgi:hypothetical protein